MTGDSGNVTAIPANVAAIQNINVERVKICYATNHHTTVHPSGQTQEPGTVGPGCEVGKALRRLEDGDWMVEITLVESGEIPECCLTQLTDDPEAN